MKKTEIAAEDVICRQFKEFRKYLKNGFLSKEERDWWNYICLEMFDDWWEYLDTNCAGGMPETATEAEEEGEG